MSSPHVRRVGRTKDQLGESPVWDDRTELLYWIDSLAGTIHRLDPATGELRDFHAPAPIGSMVLRPGEVIWLTEQASRMEVVQSSLRSPRLELPSYLQFQNPATPDRGVVLFLPDSRHVPFEFNKTQVAEYYAKRGVR